MKIFTPFKHALVLTLSLMAFMPSVQINAQVSIDATNFPDEAFRNWLLDANNIKGYGADGVLTATEIAEIDDIYINGSLSTSVSDIADMTGIEYFTALKSLTCFRNKITSLDLSKNTALKTLGITGNPLTSLTVNDDLEQFLCGQDQDLSIFNISRFTKLTLLSIRDVDLTSIDLSVFPKLETLFLQDLKLTTLDLSNNTELQWLRCFGNQLTSLDLSNNTKLNKIECYHNLIRGAGMDVLVNSLPTATDGLILVYQDETPIGNEMTTEQVATAKAKGWQVQWDPNGTYDWLDYPGTASTGIAINATNFPDENFRNWLLNSENINGYGADGVLTDDEIAGITAMWMTDKGIKDITGIDHFVNLKELSLDSNPLTSVDLVSKLPNLELLWLGFLNLEAIDLSQNSKLKSIGFTGNKFKSLELQGLADLEEALIGNNELESVNLSANKKLRRLVINNNPLTRLDLSHNTELQSLVVGGNQLPDLPLGKNTALKSIGFTKSELKTINLSKNTALETIRCEESELTRLDLPGMTNLKTLFVEKSKVEFINVEGCTALDWLICRETPLKKVVVSGCTALREIQCNDNQLTELDASGLPALKWILCQNNQLTSLKVSNCPSLTGLGIYSNKISESAMETVVADLLPVPDPENSGIHGGLTAICPSDPNEGNVINKAQVKAASDKNWLVWTTDGTVSTVYEGSEPSSIEAIDNPQAISRKYFTLDGKQVAQPAQKGIFVTNGRKVMVK